MQLSSKLLDNWSLYNFFETELVESLPENLKSSLPTIEEIEAAATLYWQDSLIQS